MHTPAKVSPDPRFKHIPHTTEPSPASSQYEADADRRQASHAAFWDGEPLTPWQEFILCRELDCSRRPRYARGGPFLSLEEATA